MKLENMLDIERILLSDYTEKPIVNAEAKHMFVALLGLVLLFGTIYLANLQESGKLGQPKLLYFALLGIVSAGIIIALLILLSALAPSLTVINPETIQGTSKELLAIDLQTAIIFLLFTTVLSLISLVTISSAQFRGFLQKHIIRSDGELRHYNATSVVHTTAIVLCVFVIINTFSNFVAIGGIEGLAEELTNNGYSVVDMLTNFLLFVGAALLGVGIFTRRRFPAVMERLGVHWPHRDTWQKWLMQGLRNLVIGALVGFAMVWVQFALSIVWQFLSSPELVAEQTSAAQELLAAVSGSLLLGLVMAVTTGIAEELLFRGALQPIFGNLLVSIFFVSLHAQYALTPATLILLLVSLVFGLLRNHYSTGASMMAHFVYNFTPIVLIFMLQQLGIPLDSLI